MDERAALALLAEELPGAGDDAAVVGGTAITTDMLHDRTDFPGGTTRYTAGWRAVGASLSDLAAMGAEPLAAVAVYAAPSFEAAELRAFVRGAREVCERVGGEYVGGDLDDHDEFTVATTAVGETDDPALRDGANPGEAVCVTGTLGRTAAALRLFDRGAVERGNELFRFDPRVAAGRAVAPHASAMMDSSDGLARSLHRLAAASDCGFSIESEGIPIDDAVRDVAGDDAEALDLATTVGEDFELVVTVPERDVETVREHSPTPIAWIGQTTQSGVELDGEELPDRGYSHPG
jgi:thiamine-monophosphate kinase